MSTPAGGAFPHFGQRVDLKGIRTPQCIQNLFFSTKLNVILMLFKPVASADSVTGPVSVDDIRTVDSLSFSLGIFISCFSNLPFVEVNLTPVSTMAGIGFPSLSSNSMVTVDVDFPSATISLGMALIPSLAGLGIGFGGVHDKKNIMPTIAVAGMPIPIIKMESG